MPTGTPLTLKCPSCRRGQFGYGRIELGVRATGETERRLTWSAHSGSGGGGCSFRGHRGRVECLDCGHAWFSTHPDSGRAESSKVD